MKAPMSFRPAGDTHQATTTLIFENAALNFFTTRSFRLLVGDQDDVKENRDDGDERRGDDTGEVRHVSPFVGLPP